MTSAEIIEIISGQIYKLDVGQAEKHALIYALVTYRERPFEISLTEWAKEIKLGRQTIWRSVKELQRLGYIRLRKRAHIETVRGARGLEREQTANVYELNLGLIRRGARQKKA